MNRSIAALAATAGLLVFAAPALAGEGLPTDSTPTTTTTTTVPTTTSVPTTTTTVPTTTSSVPTTTSTEACAVDCIPGAEETCAVDCVPIGGAGAVPASFAAGGALPFTGIEDMILPMLLGLVVLLGGVVAWRWAQLREAVAEAAGRARRLPAQDARTAYQAATRQLQIEHRARQMFMPRVA